MAGVPPGARHLRPAPGGRCADAARQDSAGRADQPISSTRWPTSASGTRAASATSRRGRTSSSISSSCTTSSRRCGVLADAGLTTREACGNSVRNITACPYAGVVGRRAVRRHAVRRSDDALPAAASRSARRCRASSRSRSKAARSITSPPAINDLGVHARCSAPDGGRGFRVTAGGGTAIMCKSARLLHEFLPASEIFRVAEAVLRVFQRLGDYQHKQRNRMKFMIKRARLGRGGARSTTASWPACRLRGEVPTLEIDPPATEAQPDWPRDPSRRRSATIASRASASSRSTGPGIMPTVVPVLSARRRGVRALARDQRARRRSSSAT